jgi:hypothetical protein
MPSTWGFRTWLSSPQREVSGLGFQDLGFRPSTRGFRTWLSGPWYLALRTYVSGPRKLSILWSSYLFPVIFLSVHHHFFFSRHFSLRLVVTDGQTHGLSEFIYKIKINYYVHNYFLIEHNYSHSVIYNFKPKLKIWKNYSVLKIIILLIWISQIII